MTHYPFELLLVANRSFINMLLKFPVNLRLAQNLQTSLIILHYLLRFLDLKFILINLKMPVTASTFTFLRECYNGRLEMTPDFYFRQAN